jgi:hypothetical protein
LTSEYEERETQAAESLRTAASVKTQVFGERGHGRDFGGLTFQGTSLNSCFSGLPELQLFSGWTSSNVVTYAEIKVLIQLESLILAQSERWRQA